MRHNNASIEGGRDAKMFVEHLNHHFWGKSFLWVMEARVTLFAGILIGYLLYDKIR